MLMPVLQYCRSSIQTAWSVAALQHDGRQKTWVRSWLKENVILRRGYAWLRWDWSVVDAHKSVWFDISAATLKSPLHSDWSPSTTWSAVVFLILVGMTLLIDKRWLVCTMVMAPSVSFTFSKHDTEPREVFQLCFILKLLRDKHHDQK